MMRVQFPLPAFRFCLIFPPIAIVLTELSFTERYIVLDFSIELINKLVRLKSLVANEEASIV